MSMNRKTNIELSKDGKSSMYILTKIDSEGFHHSIFVSKEELVEISKLINHKINMETLTFNSSILGKEDKIVQKITIKGCISNVEMINNTLKRFPFNVYVTRDGDDKTTFVYIHHDHEMRLTDLITINTAIQNAIYNCQCISSKLQELDKMIDALVDDCKRFGYEATESNKPTAKKRKDF